MDRHSKATGSLLTPALFCCASSLGTSAVSRLQTHYTVKGAGQHLGRYSLNPMRLPAGVDTDNSCSPSLWGRVGSPSNSHRLPALQLALPLSRVRVWCDALLTALTCTVRADGAGGWVAEPKERCFCPGGSCFGSSASLPLLA